MTPSWAKDLGLPNRLCLNMVMVVSPRADKVIRISPNPLRREESTFPVIRSQAVSSGQALNS